ncbi:MAG: FtsW/RodA/SpoVE family cell cycle protein, partial [Oscillospiraceae bacterium]|nr:FtsW/RodA/SpoVE family cell cycle protein [Oscillospiraceae bacterium]
HPGRPPPCAGALPRPRPFGSAPVVFVTVLVISFMRSGSFATLFLAIGGAALAIMVVLSARPYVLARFQTWGHAWEDIYDTGYQQVRAMSAAASGGLFGQGSGNGWLVDVTAGDTDMVFGVVCEELGLITGLCCVASILALAGFVVKNASAGRSSYFVIAAAASVTVMMTQMALNIFGSMDILPFTGVTFPFVSRGGSSLLSCWMLLAFVKGCDTRARGSFAVKRPEKFSGGAGVEEPEDEGRDRYGAYGPDGNTDRRRARRGRAYREDNR